MSTKPKNELSPKHLQALELIRDGSLNYDKIAKQVGWSADFLYDLIAGDTRKCGSSAVLFSEEVKRIQTDRDKHTKEDRKATEAVIMAKFREFAETYKTKKTGAKVRKELVKIMEVISKSTPKVEIGSFSYTKGLSVEDIYNEFRRLKGLGSDGRGVSPSFQGGSRVLPPAEEPGSPS